MKLTVNKINVEKTSLNAKLDEEIFIKPHLVIEVPEENDCFRTMKELYRLKHRTCLLYTSDAADATLCRSRWSPYH